MSAHTPGPWFVVEEGNDLFILNRGERAPAGIAMFPVKGAGLGATESRANAALIAAAPTLLEVCQELAESAAYWSEYDVPLGIVDRINAAIAAATGAAT